MKKLVLAGLTSLLLLGACKKDAELTQQTTTTDKTRFDNAIPIANEEQIKLSEEQSYKCFHQQTNYCGTPTTVDLLNAQHVKIGTVTVINSAQNLYVTYNVQGSGWLLSKLQLYAGDCSGVPLTYQGCPNINQFTRKLSFCGYYYPAKYTITIPLSNLPQCFCIAARAEVVKRSGWSYCNNTIAWAQGTTIGQGSTAGASFSYCKQSCGGPSTDPGCGYRAPYWFNGYNNWPGAMVTVAGIPYTQAEGFALGYYQNNVAYSEALYAFFQLASVRLSGNSIGTEAPIWGDVAVIEAWLSGKGKITTANLPAVTPEVMTAANNIEQWLDANDCDFSS